MARPKMVMAIQVTGLLLKIPLNTLFIFGGWGIPAFGGPGCAIATFIIVWLELLIGWLILRYNPFYRILHLFGTGFAWPNWKSLKELLSLGIPVGLNYFIEVTSFTFMALFIAMNRVNAVAGHQIVANFSGVLYMLPLSLASATSTLVAQSIGGQTTGDSPKNIVCRHQAVCHTCHYRRLCRLAGKDWIISLYTSNETVARQCGSSFSVPVQPAFFRCHTGNGILCPSCVQGRARPDPVIRHDTLVYRPRLRIHVCLQLLPGLYSPQNHRFFRFLVQQLRQPCHSFCRNDHHHEKNGKES